MAKFKYPQLSKNLQKLVKDFEDASVNLAFLGACDPDEHTYIRAEYFKAKKKLLECLYEMETGKVWVYPYDEKKKRTVPSTH